MANLLKVLITFAFIAIPFLLVLFIFPLWALIKIAYKAHIAHGWTIILPFVAPFMLAKVAGYSAWLGLIQFVAIFTVFGGAAKIIALFVIFIYQLWLGMCISEKFGHSNWFGLLLIIPVLNYFWLGDIAFSKNSVYID